MPATVDTSEPVKTIARAPKTGDRRAGLLLLRILVVLAILLAAAYAAVSLVMAYQLTRGNHRPLGAEGSVVETPFQNVTFRSRVDHLTLRGWLFFAPSSSGRSVIVVHGFHQNRVNADFNAND